MVAVWLNAFLTLRWCLD